MKTLALRALAWLTMKHIQWLLAQCLNNDGLYYAGYKITDHMVTVLPDKTANTITLADVWKEFHP